MTGEVLHITWWQMALGLVFVLAVGGISLVEGLRLERDLAIGTVRTFVQLFALGYVLRLVFRVDTVWLVLAVFAVMVLFGALTIRARVKERRIAFFWPILASMAISYSLISVLVVGVVVGARPWWQPQYFIPMAGMVVGNSMTACAIALDRLMGELRQSRAEVEMLLSLGADYREASHRATRAALYAGMIPSINSLMTVGLVFIPGMMTGQILAGADPVEAIRYQIVVMLMIVGSTGLGTLLLVHLVRRRCFGEAQQLLLRPRK